MGSCPSVVPANAGIQKATPETSWIPSPSSPQTKPPIEPFWAGTAVSVSYTHLDVYKRQVDGAFAIDHNFDGATKTKPAGIIHIVTGAGGARLYPQGSPSDYILKYDSSDYSYTNMEVVDKTVTIKQINTKGKVIDHFTVTK